MKHYIFPVEQFKLLFMNQQNICQIRIFETKNVVKYTIREYMAKTNHSHFSFRTICSPLSKPQKRAIQLDVHGFTRCLNHSDVN